MDILKMFFFYILNVQITFGKAAKYQGEVNTKLTLVIENYPL